MLKFILLSLTVAINQINSFGPTPNISTNYHGYIFASDSSIFFLDSIVGIMDGKINDHQRELIINKTDEIINDWFLTENFRPIDSIFEISDISLWNYYEDFTLSDQKVLNVLVSVRNLLYQKKSISLFQKNLLIKLFLFYENKNKNVGRWCDFNLFEFSESIVNFINGKKYFHSDSLIEEINTVSIINNKTTFELGKFKNKRLFFGAFNGDVHLCCYIYKFNELNYNKYSESVVENLPLEIKNNMIYKQILYIDKLIKNKYSIIEFCLVRR